MNDIIHLLPDSVANQIAAGEVVQRPASVVKELVENSIDAGAKKIQVIVTDGGRTLIQVIDDGKGMSEVDARIAFERHATSKISSAEDLFALTTMGFRGEALASIVAVSQVELVTKRAVDELGTMLQFSASRLELQEPVAAPVGSNFKVKNLFFNIPARRKFLKSNQTELNNIVSELERVALVNCDVEFSLVSNGTEMIFLPPSSFRHRIVNLFGKKINTQLIEVSVDSTMINVRGFVGAPESARKRGVQQFFFANGRYMRHPYFAKAVSEAFGDILPPGEQVPFFLMLDVEPSRIDVNIHPTKTEIKFEDEQSLWKIISASVREALGRFNAVPSLDFDDEAVPDIPVMDLSGSTDAPVVAPKITYNPSYNPFRNMKSGNHGCDSSWEALYEGVAERGKPLDLSPFDDVADVANEPQCDWSSGEEYIPMSQYKGQYILIPVKSGLMWVHQRRAHIRVLYDRFRQQLLEKHSPSQGLLFPERVEFALAESVVLESIMDELSCLGFDISSLGCGSFAINGVPAGIDGLSPAKLLADMVSSAVEQTADTSDKLHDHLAGAMARQLAIVVGQILSGDEMKTLVDDLFKTSLPSRTPDGSVIIYIMHDSDIERNFMK